MTTKERDAAACVLDGMIRNKLINEDQAHRVLRALEPFENLTGDTVNMVIYQVCPELKIT